MNNTFTFKPREGLFVSDSFTEKFGEVSVIPSKKVLEFKKLPRSMSDSEIIKEFGIAECTLEDIAALLENPPEDTHDEFSNLFYVDSFIVSVHWNSVGRRWDVGAWKLGGGGWRAGYRVFSPATVSSETLYLEQRIAKLEAFYKKAVELIPSLEV